MMAKPPIEMISMNQILKIITVGHALGIILPRDVLERLRVKEGDDLYVVDTSRGIELTKNPDYARQMKIAAKGMRKYWGALDDLADC